MLAPGSATGDRSENLMVGAPVAFGEDAAGGVYAVSRAAPLKGSDPFRPCNGSDPP